LTLPDPSGSVESFEDNAVKRENLAYLLGGLAFGFLLGFGTFHTMEFRPQAQVARVGGGDEIPSTAGPNPMAATQMPTGGGAGGGAPMAQEVNALKRALEQNPQDVQALTRLANMYHDIGEWGQAIGYYEKAVAVRPSDPNLLTDMGTCYLNVNRPDRALELFQKAHAADPSHWQSLFNEAVVLGVHLGRPEEARKALDEVDRIQPNVPGVARLRDFLSQAPTQRPAGS